MSTRAVIAEPHGDMWRGRYHHSDGYPSGLGAELWRLVQATGPTWARKKLIHEHTGWSFILNADWTQEPGYIENRSHRMYSADFSERINFQPQCYCHGDRHEEGWWIERDGDDSGTEWAYVIGDHAMTIEERECKEKRWRHVATVPWSGPEPDWDTLGA